METKKRKRFGITFNIIGAIVISLAILGIVVSTIGVASFTKTYKKSYSESTKNLAMTAASLVNGDNIDSYLADGGTSEEYKQTLQYLDGFCKSLRVSLIYVLKFDTADYSHYKSVFNAVDNTVGNTDYEPWEIGYERDTTNEEYRQKYQELFETGEGSRDVYRTRNLNGKLPHITTIVPIKNSAGKVVALLCVQRPMSDLQKGLNRFISMIALLTFILALATAVMASYFIRRQVLVPVINIEQEATRFAKENKKGDSLKNVSRVFEIEELANSIDKMETDMLNYVDNLTSVTAEKERIGAELSVASTIQENSIPNIFPAFPDIKSFDIHASMDPAKEVGGDFYNFFLIDDDHLAFVIGDVSGKGIPAALFMMVTNILVSDRTRMGGTPAEILTFVNDNICEHNKATMFVTLFLGILEISTGKITAANAGHDDAVVYHKGGDFEMFKNKHGLVIGAMSGIQYKDFEIQLEPGDKIFLYTDGVPEATDKDNNMFTLDRMVDVLNENKEKSPIDILDSVRNGVDAFVGDAPQFDDLTMLCIELKEKSPVQKLEVEATVENLQKVIDFTDGILEENDCPMKAQMNIDLAIEEAYVNIANYAYGDDTGKAEIQVSVDGREVTVTLKDSGIAYNPLEKEDPDTTLSAEERQIGGLGIFLVKKNMDSVSYKYENNQNILTMKKTI